MDSLENSVASCFLCKNLERRACYVSGRKRSAASMHHAPAQTDRHKPLDSWKKRSFPAHRRSTGCPHGCRNDRESCAFAGTSLVLSLSLCVRVKYAQRKDNRPGSLLQCRPGPSGRTGTAAGSARHAAGCERGTGLPVGPPKAPASAGSAPGGTRAWIRRICARKQHRALS